MKIMVIVKFHLYWYHDIPKGHCTVFILPCFEAQTSSTFSASFSYRNSGDSSVGELSYNMPQSAQSRLEFLGIVQTGGGPQATEQENTNKKCSESQKASTTQGGQKWPAMSTVSKVVHFRWLKQTSWQMYFSFSWFSNPFFILSCTNFQPMTLKANRSQCLWDLRTMINYYSHLLPFITVSVA